MNLKQMIKKIQETVNDVVETLDTSLVKEETSLEKESGISSKENIIEMESPQQLTCETSSSYAHDSHLVLATEAENSKDIINEFSSDTIIANGNETKKSNPIQMEDVAQDMGEIHEHSDVSLIINASDTCNEIIQETIESIEETLNTSLVDDKSSLEKIHETIIDKKVQKEISIVESSLGDDFEYNSDPGRQSKEIISTEDLPQYITPDSKEYQISDKVDIKDTLLCEEKLILTQEKASLDDSNIATQKDIVSSETVVNSEPILDRTTNGTQIQNLIESSVEEKNSIRIGLVTGKIELFQLSETDPAKSRNDDCQDQIVEQSIVLDESQLTGKADIIDNISSQDELLSSETLEGQRPITENIMDRSKTLVEDIEIKSSMMSLQSETEHINSIAQKIQIFETSQSKNVSIMSSNKESQDWTKEKATLVSEENENNSLSSTIMPDNYNILKDDSVPKTQIIQTKEDNSSIERVQFEIKVSSDKINDTFISKPFSQAPSPSSQEVTQITRSINHDCPITVNASERDGDKLKDQFFIPINKPNDISSPCSESDTVEKPGEEDAITNSISVLMFKTLFENKTIQDIACLQREQSPTNEVINKSNTNQTVECYASSQDISKDSSLTETQVNVLDYLESSKKETNIDKEVKAQVLGQKSVASEEQSVRPCKIVPPPIISPDMDLLNQYRVDSGTHDIDKLKLKHTDSDKQRVSPPILHSMRKTATSPPNSNRLAYSSYLKSSFDREKRVSELRSIFEKPKERPTRPFQLSHKKYIFQGDDNSGTNDSAIEASKENSVTDGNYKKDNEQCYREELNQSETKDVSLEELKNLDSDGQKSEISLNSIYTKDGLNSVTSDIPSVEIEPESEDQTPKAPLNQIPSSETSNKSESNIKKSDNNSAEEGFGLERKGRKLVSTLESMEKGIMEMQISVKRFNSDSSQKEGRTSQIESNNDQLPSKNSAPEGFALEKRGRKLVSTLESMERGIMEMQLSVKRLNEHYPIASGSQDSDNELTRDQSPLKDENQLEIQAVINDEINREIQSIMNDETKLKEQSITNDETRTDDHSHMQDKDEPEDQLMINDMIASEEQSMIMNSENELMDQSILENKSKSDEQEIIIDEKKLDYQSVINDESKSVDQQTMIIESSSKDLQVTNIEKSSEAQQIMNIEDSSGNQQIMDIQKEPEDQASINNETKLENHLIMGENMSDDREINEIKLDNQSLMGEECNFDEENMDDVINQSDMNDESKSLNEPITNLSVLKGDDKSGDQSILIESTPDDQQIINFEGKLEDHSISKDADYKFNDIPDIGNDNKSDDGSVIGNHVQSDDILVIGNDVESDDVSVIGNDVKCDDVSVIGNDVKSDDVSVMVTGTKSEDFAMIRNYTNSDEALVIGNESKPVDQYLDNHESKPENQPIMKDESNKNDTMIINDDIRFEDKEIMKDNDNLYEHVERDENKADDKPIMKDEIKIDESNGNEKNVDAQLIMKGEKIIDEQPILDDGDIVNDRIKNDENIIDEQPIMKDDQPIVNDGSKVYEPLVMENENINDEHSIMKDGDTLSDQPIMEDGGNMNDFPEPCLTGGNDSISVEVDLSNVKSNTFDFDSLENKCLILNSKTDDVQEEKSDVANVASEVIGINDDQSDLLNPQSGCNDDRTDLLSLDIGCNPDQIDLSSPDIGCNDDQTDLLNLQSKEKCKTENLTDSDGKETVLLYENEPKDKSSEQLPDFENEGKITNSIGGVDPIAEVYCTDSLLDSDMNVVNSHDKMDLLSSISIQAGQYDIDGSPIAIHKDCSNMELVEEKESENTDLLNITHDESIDRIRKDNVYVTEGDLLTLGSENPSPVAPIAASTDDCQSLIETVEAENFSENLATFTLDGDNVQVNYLKADNQIKNNINTDDIEPVLSLKSESALNDHEFPLPDNGQPSFVPLVNMKENLTVDINVNDKDLFGLSSEAHYTSDRQDVFSSSLVDSDIETARLAQVIDSAVDIQESIFVDNAEGSIRKMEDLSVTSHSLGADIPFDQLNACEKLKEKSTDYGNLSNCEDILGKGSRNIAYGVNTSKYNETLLGTDSSFKTYSADLLDLSHNVLSGDTKTERKLEDLPGNECTDPNDLKQIMNSQDKAVDDKIVLASTDSCYQFAIEEHERLDFEVQKMIRNESNESSDSVEMSHDVQRKLRQSSEEITKYFKQVDLDVDDTSEHRQSDIADIAELLEQDNEIVMDNSFRNQDQNSQVNKMAGNDKSQDHGQTTQENEILGDNSPRDQDENIDNLMSVESGPTLSMEDNINVSEKIDAENNEIIEQNGGQQMVKESSETIEIPNKEGKLMTDGDSEIKDESEIKVLSGDICLQNYYHVQSDDINENAIDETSTTSSINTSTFFSIKDYDADCMSTAPPSLQPDIDLDDEIDAPVNTGGALDNMDGKNVAGLFTQFADFLRSRSSSPMGSRSVSPMVSRAASPLVSRSASPLPYKSLNISSQNTTEEHKKLLECELEKKLSLVKDLVVDIEEEVKDSESVACNEETSPNINNVVIGERVTNPPSSLCLSNVITPMTKNEVVYGMDHDEPDTSETITSPTYEEAPEFIKNEEPIKSSGSMPNLQDETPDYEDAPEFLEDSKDNHDDLSSAEKLSEISVMCIADIDSESKEDNLSSPSLISSGKIDTENKESHAEREHSEFVPNSNEALIEVSEKEKTDNYIEGNQPCNSDAKLNIEAENSNDVTESNFIPGETGNYLFADCTETSSKQLAGEDNMENTDVLSTTFKVEEEIKFDSGTGIDLSIEKNKECFAASKNFTEQQPALQKPIDETNYNESTDVSKQLQPLDLEDNMDLMDKEQALYNSNTTPKAEEEALSDSGSDFSFGVEDTGDSFAVPKSFIDQQVALKISIDKADGIDPLDGEDKSKEIQSLLVQDDKEPVDELESKYDKNLSLKVREEIPSDSGSDISFGVDDTGDCFFVPQSFIDQQVSMRISIDKLDDAGNSDASKDLQPLAEVDKEKLCDVEQHALLKVDDEMLSDSSSDIGFSVEDTGDCFAVPKSFIDQQMSLRSSIDKTDSTENINHSIMQSNSESYPDNCADAENSNIDASSAGETYNITSNTSQSTDSEFHKSIQQPISSKPTFILTSAANKSFGRDSSCESDSDDDMRVGPIKGCRPLVIPLSPSPSKSPVTESESSQSESEVTTDEDDIEIPNTKPKVKYAKPAHNYRTKLHTIPELSEDEDELPPVRPPRPRKSSVGRRKLSDSKATDSPKRGIFSSSTGHLSPNLELTSLEFPSRSPENLTCQKIKDLEDNIFDDSDENERKRSPYFASPSLSSESDEYDDDKKITYGRCYMQGTFLSTSPLPSPRSPIGLRSPDRRGMSPEVLNMYEEENTILSECTELSSDNGQPTIPCGDSTEMLMNIESHLSTAITDLSQSLAVSFVDDDAEVVEDSSFFPPMETLLIPAHAVPVCIDSSNENNGDNSLEMGDNLITHSEIDVPHQTQYVITPLGEKSVLTSQTFAPPMEMLLIPELPEQQIKGENQNIVQDIPKNIDYLEKAEENPGNVINESKCESLLETDFINSSEEFGIPEEHPHKYESEIKDQIEFFHPEDDLELSLKNISAHKFEKETSRESGYTNSMALIDGFQEFDEMNATKEDNSVLNAVSTDSEKCEGATLDDEVKLSEEHLIFFQSGGLQHLTSTFGVKEPSESELLEGDRNAEWMLQGRISPHSCEWLSSPHRSPCRSPAEWAPRSHLSPRSTAVKSPKHTGTPTNL
nr:UCFe protein [Hippolyte inermis]